MSKCEKTREIIKIYTKHLCKGENCNNNICCEICLWSGESALAELDEMELENSKLEDANIELARKVCQARGRIKELEAENKRYRGALEEIKLNHTQPHKQRQGCRRTSTICEEALKDGEE